ncbi:DUF4870 domain-containing protein [Oryzobacter sp. R7]|uniref:DUF4870 domain-containing protein n=1 Tax=Oryzobacter faecalis TaxID=3388656 RepID=UPI00398D4600
MSDTTPRPDETTDPTPDRAPDPTPADPTPPPAPEAPPTPEAPPAPEAAAAAPEYPQPYPPQVPPPGYAQQPPPGYQAQPAYTPQPQAPLSPADERTWGMLSHVVGGAAMILSGGFLGFVGSLVIYLMYKDRGPFVRAHAANSLNVQITAAIGFLIGWVLVFVLIGFAILPLVFIWAVVMHIIGAVKANNGEWWTPPLTPRFIK